MKGSYKFYTKTNRVRHEFTLSYPISIIDADSGTGKTTLFSYAEDGLLVGDIPVIPLRLNLRNMTGMLGTLSGNTNSLILIDDPSHDINNKEIVHAINNSENYYLIFSHDLTQTYTYPVQAVYDMFYDGCYNRLIPKYKDIMVFGHYTDKVNRIITEDAASGRQILNNLTNVTPANGRDNVINALSKTPTLYCVDGAAFGANIHRIIKKIEVNDYPAVLCMTPSFEHNVLCWTSIRKLVNDRLLDAVNNAEFPEYLTHEQYYTDLLKQVVPMYSKSKLCPYLNNDTIKKQYVQALESATGLRLDRKQSVELTETQLEELKKQYPVAYSVYTSGGDLADVAYMIQDIKNRYK